MGNVTDWLFFGNCDAKKKIVMGEQDSAYKGKGVERGRKDDFLMFEMLMMENRRVVVRKISPKFSLHLLLRKLPGPKPLHALYQPSYSTIPVLSSPRFFYT